MPLSPGYFYNFEFMADIKKIISEIDTYLAKTGLTHITPVEANKLLEKAGLLKDYSDSRPGLPLRDLLRDGKIPHAFQKSGKGSKWAIPHSNNANNISYDYRNAKSEKKSRLKAGKGKRTFTITEIESIRQLIKDKQLASPIKQKGIRQKIRNLGFYHSQFDARKFSYTLHGFEALIRSGQIKIGDDKILKLNT